MVSKHRYTYFRTQGQAWSVTCTIRVQLSTDPTTDLLELCRISFIEAVKLHAKPEGIRFLVAHCNIEPLVTASDARPQTIQVRCFLKTTKSFLEKWAKWLPPREKWRPMRGGLHGNPAYEDAMADLDRARSGWMEMLREGTFLKNNAARRQASPAVFSLRVPASTHLRLGRPAPPALRPSKHPWGPPPHSPLLANKHRLSLIPQKCLNGLNGCDPYNIYSS